MKLKMLPVINDVPELVIYYILLCLHRTQIMSTGLSQGVWFRSISRYRESELVFLQQIFVAVLHSTHFSWPSAFGYHGKLARSTRAPRATRCEPQANPEP
jgi:hypothetical protein